MHKHAELCEAVRLPDTPQGCRERLVVLQSEIASIRIQIATTDIRRQNERKTLDPAWYHRAKSALRLHQQELALVNAHLAKLNHAANGNHRERFKDALIEVIRCECDDRQWQEILSRARKLQEIGHG